MKKVFVVAGELSGDRTAAWYIHQRRKNDAPCYWEGVGGDFVRGEKVILFERFEVLNVTGVAEVISHTPRIFRFMWRLADYIVAQKFDEVVLVDFPGFNLKLAGILKKQASGIKITYVAPPQLWCWGAWRLKKIKKLCDTVVVLYPFEVNWYAQHGVNVQWFGCPVYEALTPYFHDMSPKEPLVALIPGSRHGEVTHCLPILAAVAQRLYKKYPYVHFVMPLAQSFSESFLQQKLQRAGLTSDNFPLTLVREEHEKYALLNKCCLAITKPGTVTLEFALLKVPAVVFFRVSWLTYALARCVIKVPYLSLPNLLLGKPVYPECVQHHCTVEEIMVQADKVLASYFGDKVFYRSIERSLEPIRAKLQSR